MSICYHGFSETPGPSKDCEVCIAFKERDAFKAALEKIAALDCHYPDGDFMGEDMCAKIALGKNCPQCGANTVPCAFHGSTERT